MNTESGQSRRQFLRVGVAAGTGLLLAQRAEAGEAHGVTKGQANPTEEIAATEDLMREHGVLNRILLIYEEGLRRLRRKEDVPPDVFHKCATLVRNFVEDYHEKLEEDFIFPEFQKQNKLVDLVKVLREQHQAGRTVTDVIARITGGNDCLREDARKEMAAACRAFIRMYRPHETREDTVLFPALRTIVQAQRIEELGEQFEEREDRLFGEGGFERTVEQVAAIEKQLGIYDLSQFTPK